MCQIRQAHVATFPQHKPSVESPFWPCSTIFGALCVRSFLTNSYSAHHSYYFTKQQNKSCAAVLPHVLTTAWCCVCALLFAIHALIWFVRSRVAVAMAFVSRQVKQVFSLLWVCMYVCLNACVFVRLHKLITRRVESSKRVNTAQ